MSKDQAFRRYHQHKESQNADFGGDEDLAELTELEKEARKKTQIAREKSVRARRIASLRVQEAEADFERRRKLFQDKKTLLDFAEKVLPVATPSLWLRLHEVCEIMEIKVEDALLEAIGPQTEYEETRIANLENDDEESPLDMYLCLRLQDWVLKQEKEIVELHVTSEGDKRREEFILEITSKAYREFVG